MEVAGAIFDCDGTLIDSMGMWAKAWDWLAARHGHGPVPLERIESLSLRDTCGYFHDELGIPASPDDLYEELCAHVRDAYEHEVALMPGARALLEELYAASTLRNFAPALEKNQKVRVVHNYDDFLLSDDDREFLDRTFGSRLTWFDHGGHLGNLYVTSVQETLLEMATAPEPEPLIEKAQK